MKKENKGGNTMNTARIRLKFEETHNSLTITVDNTQHVRVLHTNTMDDKLIIANIFHTISVIEFVTGKTLKPILTKGKFSETTTCYEFKLPISECGKYLLIKNPLSIKE